MLTLLLTVINLLRGAKLCKGATTIAQEQMRFAYLVRYLHNDSPTM